MVQRHSASVGEHVVECSSSYNVFGFYWFKLANFWAGNKLEIS